MKISFIVNENRIDEINYFIGVANRNNCRFVMCIVGDRSGWHDAYIEGKRKDIKLIEKLVFAH